MKLVGPLQEPKFPSCMYHFGTPHLLKIPDFWSMPPQWRKIRRPLRTPLNQNFSIRKLPRWQSLNPPKKKKNDSPLSNHLAEKKKKESFLDKLFLSLLEGFPYQISWFETHLPGREVPPRFFFGDSFSSTPSQRWATAKISHFLQGDKGCTG